MVAIVKRLRPRVVIPLYVGSNPTSHPIAMVAQSVEQRTENPCVVGSIPTRGTI